MTRLKVLLVVVLAGGAACSLRSLDSLTGGDGSGGASSSDARAPSPGAPALLVVGATPPSRADAAILERMMMGGQPVVVVDDDALATVDPKAAAVVVVSRTALTGKVMTRFRDLARPVVMSDPLLYDDMGMVDAAVSGNRGVATAVTILNIESGGQALAGGLTGMVTIATIPAQVTWGMPGAEAVRVASVAGLPDHLSLFAYETGAHMPGLLAPARRVGIFLSETTASTLTPAGWALFDAALTWALGR
jgi:hypothetical protein